MKIVSEEYLAEEIRRMKRTLDGLKPSGELMKATEEYIEMLEKILISRRNKREQNRND